MAFRISLAGCTKFLPEYPVNVSNSFRDNPGHASNINHPRNERPARIGRQRRLRPPRNWDKQKSATFLPKITRQSTSSDLRSQHSALLHFITSTHKRRLRKWGDTDTTGKDGRTRQWNSEAEMAGPEFEDGNNFSANGPTLRYIIDRMPRLVETGPRRLRSLFTIRKRKRRTGGWDREFPTRSVCQLIINNLPVYDEQEEGWRKEGGVATRNVVWSPTYRLKGGTVNAIFIFSGLSCGNPWFRPNDDYLLALLWLPRRHRLN